MAQPIGPTKYKVLLRKGMKFSELVEGKGKRRNTRIRHVGPCEVEMTEPQIEAFKDLLQTAPQVVVSEPSTLEEVVAVEEPETEGENLNV